jgi:hypothetical protein
MLDGSIGMVMMSNSSRSALSRIIAVSAGT